MFKFNGSNQEGYLGEDKKTVTMCRKCTMVNGGKKESAQLTGPRWK